MADPLYLSIWFPTFSPAEMMPRAASVLKLFPFSSMRPGIEYVSVQPVSWNEPTVLERRFRPGLDADQAIAIAGDLLHDDYAYVFEVMWDLWQRSEETDNWKTEPTPARAIVNGVQFDDGSYQQNGHIQFDFGLDTPFLYEDIELDEMDEARVRANVQKLISFTNVLEKNCGLSGRVLWSESEENLAQKLIARLQKVQ
ncbi:MAG TPA: hypothetical protein VG897_09095 [Terriglobales bacterium]|nr:hypothetical protein [Terriglobales bacterium]